MPVAQERLTIETKPREIKEITREVAGWAARQGIASGLLTIFIPHTSASLLIQENYSPAVRQDLAAFLGRLAPEEPALYRHNDEGPDDMPAHLKSALTQVQLKSRSAKARPGSAPDRGFSSSSIGPRRIAAI